GGHLPAKGADVRGLAGRRQRRPGSAWHSPSESIDKPTERAGVGGGPASAWASDPTATQPERSSFLLDISKSDDDAHRRAVVWLAVRSCWRQLGPCNCSFPLSAVAPPALFEPADTLRYSRRLDFKWIQPWPGCAPSCSSDSAI
ncbi:hypothetical protein THAOC_12033, partial [Thalassiosira oceanica]